jgi:division protein CdvB (Snf7/Vps24/ESCRT-III family)
LFDGQANKRKGKGHKGGAGKQKRKQQKKSAQKELVSKLGSAIYTLQGQKKKLDAKEAELQQKVEAAARGSLFVGIWAKPPSN